MSKSSLVSTLSCTLHKKKCIKSKAYS